MGGTLPAAARAVTRRGDISRQAVAALYGLNTMGAVLGCLVGDPRMEVAGRELREYLAHEPVPLGAGLANP
jgi:hypothetical protein